MGAAVPCSRSICSDRLLGRTPRPPSWWARADGGCCLLQALHRQRPPPGQDSPSPQLVGPRQWGQPSPAVATLQEFHCPLPPGSVAVHCRSCTAHCPQAVRQCIAGVPLPTAPRQCGSALQELHYPLPPGSEAVHSRSCTAHCPQKVRQCIAGVVLPTAPRQCGSALQGFSSLRQRPSPGQDSPSP